MNIWPGKLSCHHTDPHVAIYSDINYNCYYRLRLRGIDFVGLWANVSFSESYDNYSVGSACIMV